MTWDTCLPSALEARYWNEDTSQQGRKPTSSKLTHHGWQEWAVCVLHWVSTARASTDVQQHVWYNTGILQLKLLYQPDSVCSANVLTERTSPTERTGPLHRERGSQSWLTGHYLLLFCITSHFFFFFLRRAKHSHMTKVQESVVLNVLLC